MSCSILIAEKDIEMASIIAGELKSESVDISIVSDGNKLLQKIKNSPCNLLVMSFKIPEFSGFDLLREIRKIKNSEEMGILVLADPLDDTILTKMIEEGATDFLLKPYQRGQLINHVRTLRSRIMGPEEKKALADGQYILGRFRLNLHSSDFYQGDTRVHLTPSEFKLLEALFRKRGTILTRDQLIEEVQGAGVVVIDRAIDTHVFSLRKKLGDSSELIETVRGVGYRIANV